MQFCRCACLTAPELDNLEAAAKQQVTTPQGSSPANFWDGTHPGLDSVSGDPKPEPAPPSTIATAQAREYVQRPSTEAARFEGRSQDGRAQRCITENGANGTGPPTRGSPPVELKQSLVHPDGRQRRRGEERDGREERTNSEGDSIDRANEAGGGGNAVAAREACPFPRKALSAQNEVAALMKAMDCVVQARDAFPTTLEHDEARMADELFKPSSC